MPESTDNLAGNSQSSNPSDSGGAMGLGGGLDAQGMAFLRSIEERMGALRAAAAGIEESKKQLAQQQQLLDEQRVSAMHQQRQAEELVAQARRAQEDLDEKVALAERQASSMRAGLTSEKKDLEASRAEFAKQQEVFAQQQELLASQRRELAEHAGELEQLRQRLVNREAELAAMQRDCEQRASSVQQQFEVLTQQRQQVEQMLAEARANQQQSAAISQQQLTQMRAELEASFAGQQSADVAKLQKKLATLQEIIDQAGRDAHEAEERYEQLRKQLDGQKAELASREAELDQQRRVIEELRQQVAGESEKLSHAQRLSSERHASEIKSLEVRLVESHDLCEQQRQMVRKLEVEVAERDAKQQAMQQQLSQSQAEVAKLRGRLQAAAETLSVSSNGSFAAVSGGASSEELEKLQQSVRRLEAELAQQQNGMHETAERLLKSEELLVQKDSELIRLRSEMAHSAQHAASEILHRSSERSSETPEFNVVRRARLRKLRLLLRSEYEKLVLAKDAIVRQRQMVEEQSARAMVYGRATEPGFDHQGSQDAQAPVLTVKGRTATAASMVVLVALVSMTVIGLLTYAIGSTLAPSTFAARVVLAADSQGKPMTPEQMRKFNQGHVNLAGDVQVIALAADRFAQRGMSEWADAGALAEKLSKQLTVLSDVPGQVTLELRAEGRLQTLRAMETFNTSLVVVANSLGASRGDGAITVVKQQPIVSEEAVSGPAATVVMIAAGLGVLAAWGGGIAAFFGLKRSMDRSIKNAVAKAKPKTEYNEFGPFIKKAA